MKDLNDPYEATIALQHNEKDLREFISEKIFSMTVSGLLETVPRIERIIHSTLKSELVFDRIRDQTVGEVLGANGRNKALGDLVRKKHQTYHAASEQNQQMALDKKFGILCLSDTCESYLMWSHYAEKHCGYCIGFDDQDEWFSPLESLVDQKGLTPTSASSSEYIGRLRKVQYLNQRPQQNENVTIESPFNPFFVKSLEWKYEEEYRMLYPLRLSEPDAKATKASLKQPHCKLVERGNNLFLRRFPSDLIKEVVFGVRCSLEIQRTIRESLTAHDVEYFFAIPSSIEYSMTKEPALFDYPYDPMDQDLIQQGVVRDCMMNFEATKS